MKMVLKREYTCVQRAPDAATVLAARVHSCSDATMPRLRFEANSVDFLVREDWTAR